MKILSRQQQATRYGWVRAARANEPEQPETDLTDEQILERLLALNLERAAEQAKAARVPSPKAQRAKQEDELV